MTSTLMVREISTLTSVQSPSTATHALALPAMLSPHRPSVLHVYGSPSIRGRFVAALSDSFAYMSPATVAAPNMRAEAPTVNLSPAAAIPMPPPTMPPPATLPPPKLSTSANRQDIRAAPRSTSADVEPQALMLPAAAALAIEPDFGATSLDAVATASSTVLESEAGMPPRPCPPQAQLPNQGSQPMVHHAIGSMVSPSGDTPPTGTAYVI